MAIALVQPLQLSAILKVALTLSAWAEVPDDARRCCCFGAPGRGTPPWLAHAGPSCPVALHLPLSILEACLATNVISPRLIPKAPALVLKNASKLTILHRPLKVN